MSHELIALTAETKAEVAAFPTGTSHELQTHISHTHMSHELIALTAVTKAELAVCSTCTSPELHIYISLTDVTRT